jgi:hypothetical protein
MAGKQAKSLNENHVRDLLVYAQHSRDFLEPTLEFVRPLPASAIIPVAILFLGLSNQMSVAVIAFGAIWPVLLSSVYEFGSVNVRLQQVSALLGFSRADNRSVARAKMGSASDVKVLQVSPAMRPSCPAVLLADADANSLHVNKTPREAKICVSCTGTGCFRCTAAQHF